MAAPGTAISRPSWQFAWILGSWQDLLLFIATPLLILLLLPVARLGLSVAEIALYVAAFGALGHHLPGMMRAYGDRELFARFRLRFIVSPIFLVAVCLYCSLHLRNPLNLVLAMWGAWHGLAQVYGFARIYDAKVSRGTWLTNRLDLWLCVAWFGAGLVNSPGRMSELLAMFTDSGGPLLVTELVGGLRSAWSVATLAVTGAFAVNAIRQWRAGRPASLAKLLLFVSSFGFWWYAMVSIQNVLLGIALFEIFHDVQYLAIVWGYNRKRVETGHDLGGFMRFLFRRSGALIGVYVGLVFAYGSTRLGVYAIDQELLRNVVMGLIVASTLLHFYFDAFIWSVRDAETRESLGLDSASGVAAVQARFANLGPQAAKWALFVLPLIWLGVIGAGDLPSQVARRAAVVNAEPASADARFKLASALVAEGRAREAIVELEEAIALRPGFARAYANLGGIYLMRDQPERAAAALEAALGLEPGLAIAHQGLGRLLLAREEMDAAARAFERALASEPHSAKAEYFLGVTLLARDRPDEASLHFERALELDADAVVGTLGAKVAFRRLAAVYDAQGRTADGARWRKAAIVAREPVPID
jgi:tetratricopeptide (TPR) repeat protein